MDEEEEVQDEEREEQDEEDRESKARVMASNDLERRGMRRDTWRWEEQRGT